MENKKLKDIENKVKKSIFEEREKAAHGALRRSILELEECESRLEIAKERHKKLLKLDIEDYAVPQKYEQEYLGVCTG